MSQNPELGDLVRDKITGFEGVVTCVSHWLSGCDRVVVQPQKLGEGNFVRSTEVFDAIQVEVVKAGVIVLDPVKPSKRTKGGPQRDPYRGADPQ